tara:strand:+ start:202 stop:525 length:324 start_codon:yes stop_codon:yes gene_type:complete
MFDCTNASNLNGTSPGVIRVYQDGFESSAATLDVSGITYLTVSFDLEIKGTLGPRIVIIDGWDPLAVDPNNLCSFGGNLTLIGRPLVSTTGGTQIAPQQGAGGPGAF